MHSTYRAICNIKQNKETHVTAYETNYLFEGKQTQSTIVFSKLTKLQSQ